MDTEGEEVEHLEAEGVGEGLEDTEGELVKEVVIVRVTELVCDRDLVKDVEPVPHTVTLTEEERDTDGLVLCDTVCVAVILGVRDVVDDIVVESEVVPQLVALNEDDGEPVPHMVTLTEGEEDTEGLVLCDTV